MRLQFFSDIHLEFAPLDVPATSADVIVAAGDIGVGAAGAHWLAGLGKPVVYVAGNHEFYGGDMGAVQAAIETATAGTGVRYLENGVTDIAGVRFIGSTLWAAFEDGRPELLRAAGRTLNDFQQIRLGAGQWTPEASVAACRRATSFLATALARPWQGPTVVVTHHAPTRRSWRGPEDATLRPAYCNDLDDLCARHAPALWFHGHTHWTTDYRIGATRVLCNPRGYHGLQRVTGFDPGRVVDLAPAGADRLPSI